MMKASYDKKHLGFRKRGELMLSGLKNFLITLCVSLLIFASLTYMILHAANNAFFSPDKGGIVTETGTSPPVSSASNKPNGRYVAVTDSQGNVVTDSNGAVVTTFLTNDQIPPDATSSFTILLVGTDYQPDLLHDYDLSELNSTRTEGFYIKERVITTDTLLLIHINAAQKSVVFMSFPANMRVSVDGGYLSLGSLYTKKGIAFLCNKITALTGFQVNYYAVCHLPDCASIIDELGGVDFDVPCAMNYIDESQDLIISIPKGKRWLDGETALKMLRFNSYPSGSGLSRTAVGIDFTKAMLSKLSNASYSKKISTLYNAVSSDLTTNFSADDLTHYLDIFFAYSEFDTFTLNYPGSTLTDPDTGNTFFSPDLAKGIDLCLPYR